MKSAKLAAALSLLMMATLPACALEDDTSFTGDEPIATGQTAAAVSSDCPAPDDGTEVPPDACANAVKCSCKCNGVAVTVTIYPDIHGETCKDVNDRPCNTGSGWSVYKDCQ